MRYYSLRLLKFVSAMILLLFSSFVIAERETCENGGPDGVGDQIEQLIECLEGVHPPIPAPRPDPPEEDVSVVGFGLHSSFFSGGADCTEYITNDGRLGTSGEIVAREIMGEGRSTSRSEIFFSDDIRGIENTCPNWSRLTDVQKTHFWVWHIAAIAWKEGTCVENRSRGDATDGAAGGELQVPESWNGPGGRRHRGPGCNVEPVTRGRAVNINGNYIGDFIMALPENYIPCGVEILGGSLCGYYHNNGTRCDSPGSAPRPLFGGGQYWEELRNNPNTGGTIGQRTRRFPLCN